MENKPYLLKINIYPIEEGSTKLIFLIIKLKEVCLKKKFVCYKFIKDECNETKY